MSQGDRADHPRSGTSTTRSRFLNFGLGGNPERLKDSASAALSFSRVYTMMPECEAAPPAGMAGQLAEARAQIGVRDDHFRNGQYGPVPVADSRL